VNFVKNTFEMIRIVLCLLCVSMFSVSCLKNADNAGCPYEITSISAPQDERDSVEAYLDSMGLQAVEHETGFYYQVVTPGTDIGQMSLCSKITINYVGKLKSGTEFDRQNNIELILGALIEGWKKGLPLIKQGGEINLYVPPTLAYGPNEIKNNQTGQVIIPAKSMLIFNVRLLDYTVGN
jgi:FKBP-type peptidyl-prolyl cis-trans isomerase FkpA